VLYYLSHVTSLFSFMYFMSRISHLCPGQPRLPSSYLCFPHSLMTGAHHHTQLLLVEMGSYYLAGLRPQFLSLPPQ
jgi:hypothetical protein